MYACLLQYSCVPIHAVYHSIQIDGDVMATSQTSNEDNSTRCTYDSDNSVHMAQPICGNQQGTCVYGQLCVISLLDYRPI